MERDDKATVDILSARPNGRSAPGLVVDRERRKPLFTRSSSKENDANDGDRKPQPGSRGHGSGTQLGGGIVPDLKAPSSSDSRAGGSLGAKSSVSPESRIPAPKTTTFQSRPRRPITLTEAYKMAEEEELRRDSSPVDGDVSPSPAPRPWLARNDSDKQRQRKLSEQSPAENKGRRGFLTRRPIEPARDDDTGRSINSVDSASSRRTGSSVSEEELVRRRWQRDEGERQLAQLLGRDMDDSTGGSQKSASTEDSERRRKEIDEDEKYLAALAGQQPTDPGRRKKQIEQDNRRLHQLLDRDGKEHVLLQKSESGRSSVESKAENSRKHSSGFLSRGAGLFSRSRIGPKIEETGRNLARKASNSSLDEKPKDTERGEWATKGHVPAGFFRRFMSMPLPEESAGLELGSADTSGILDQDIPIPSIETAASQEPTPPSSRPASANPEYASPNKSYAWQVDAEFTAGDLQISNSPRISVNSKLDQTRTGGSQSGHNRNGSPEAEAGGHADRPMGGTRARGRNTKLDEIREREAEVENMEFAPTITSFPERRNTKLDEIRAREIENLSKRAIATSRLDEIRELNSMSGSEEVSRQPSRESVRETTPGFDPETKERLPRKTIQEEEGEKIPNTPITIFKNSGTATDVKMGSGTDESSKDSRGSSKSRPGVSHPRDESRELLRRLARVTSTSPTPEKTSEKEATAPRSERIVREDSDQKSTSSRQSPNDAQKSPNTETRDRETLKPAVGFAGLRRVRSTDSTKEKRSSMALSENDPTDRIQQEMQLFAPLENQSERGSLREPSPKPDSDEDGDDTRNPMEDTPKPPKRESRIPPTPKITGAYVETPATAKVERIEVNEELPKAAQRPSTGSSSPLRGRKSSTSSESEPGRRDAESESRPSRETAATITRATGRRRARSLPKTRPPLINTAKPPTVKDDLLELQRTHHIDDSTLDDFDEMFAPSPSVSMDLDAVLKDLTGADEDLKMEVELQGQSDREKQLERYKRMEKSLKTGLMEIRTAKQGIERLEGKVVSQSEVALPPKSEHSIDHDVHCPSYVDDAPRSSVAYVHIPVPRLYHTEPTFRLTVFGMLFLLLSLWYTTESTICAMYCRPTTCSTPCIWSSDDPAWGSALPIKLDQWSTGGLGRKLAAQLTEEVEDIAADAWDFVTGSDISEVDVGSLSFRQKRRHRRRLRKKGLVKPREEPPEHKAKWDSWRQTRLARERVREAREMGYDIEDGESFAADERIG